MNKVIKIIEQFVLSLTTDEKYKDNGICINNTKYLLGQILRAYDIPQEHYFISEEAKNLWEKLTTDDINKYFYREKVICDKAENICLNTYTGASKKGKSCIINKGDKITYNDVFHNEHIVPIYDIINGLIDLINRKDVNEESIKKILDCIYICRITKEENNRLSRRWSRSKKLNYLEAMEKYYKPKNIKIVNEYLFIKKS